MRVKFLGYDCEVMFHRYGNNRVAISLEDVQGETIATCTVNIPSVDLQPGYVLIKNYSENSGILDVLVQAGVVSSPRCYVRSGFVSIPVCELLVKEDDK